MPQQNTAKKQNYYAGVPNLLTVTELAKLLRLTKRGVYSLIQQKRIPFIKISNRVRFDHQDVLQYLSENRVPASNEE